MIRLGKNVHFKDLFFGAVYKFQCGLCNEFCYGECVRDLNVGIGGHHHLPNKLSLRRGL